MTRASPHLPRAEERPKGVLRALPLTYVDDASLARALAEGQPPAAASAWDRFAPLVRGLLWQSLGPGTDIDDLLQDVFLTLFKRVRDLRDPNALRSFVVGITVRTARSELRRRRVRRWLSFTDDGELPEAPGQDADLSAREALRRFYAILDRLDPEPRLVFLLRHTQGIELTEIAASLGCSLATAKRRLVKATERILFSLRNWGILYESAQRHHYTAQRRHFHSSDPRIELWLLAAALLANPAQEIPFADLLRLPELFPFCFSVGIDQVRQSAWFEVQRQGPGWEMVRVVKR